MATIEVAPRTAEARRTGQRRVRVVIRRVSPWSVMKFSLIFYFCLMLIIMLGLAILYAIIGSLGILDSTAQLLSEVGFGGGTFEFNGGDIFRTVFLIGVISVVVWSAVTVFVAFLYNLIADLVGGIEITLLERR